MCAEELCNIEEKVYVIVMISIGFSMALCVARAECSLRSLTFGLLAALAWAAQQREAARRRNPPLLT